MAVGVDVGVAVGVDVGVAVGEAVGVGLATEDSRKRNPFICGAAESAPSLWPVKVITWLVSSATKVPITN